MNQIVNNTLDFYNIAYSPIKENNILNNQRLNYKKKKFIIKGKRIIKDNKVN